MRVVFSDLHRLHDPLHDIQGGVPAPMVERAERAERILRALTAADDFTFQAPVEHGLAPIEAVHAPGLIAFLQEACPAPGEELFPDTFVHPGSGVPPREPATLPGRLGFWCFDTGTPLLAGTYAAARSAVDVALTAADLALQGETLTYGLCRPPGHHAARSLFGGFSYFNNAAIAAQHVVQRTGSRVAILDLDYHHGNGTQQIFYARDDVLYVSLHADPREEFPYFSGFADETGTGPGVGATLNVPLPKGTTDAEYLDALDVALEAISRFAPAMTVVSLGMDTYVHDPLGAFGLTTGGYRACGRRMSGLSPMIVLQEGGYYLPDLGANVREFLLGAAEGRG